MVNERNRVLSDIDQAFLEARTISGLIRYRSQEIPFIIWNGMSGIF